jgi:hypothetical protein
MDFVERIFHFSPDGGNGFTELLILICLALAASILYVNIRRQRQKQRATDLSFQLAPHHYRRNPWLKSLM